MIVHASGLRFGADVPVPGPWLGIVRNQKPLRIRAATAGNSLKETAPAESVIVATKSMVLDEH